MLILHFVQLFNTKRASQEFLSCEARLVLKLIC